tara:strand:+ start:1914 stop:2057 length:144 start_codon:yes stop_codon:yes gene_type:complete
MTSIKPSEMHIFFFFSHVPKAVGLTVNYFWKKLIVSRYLYRHNPSNV